MKHKLLIVLEFSKPYFVPIHCHLVFATVTARCRKVSKKVYAELHGASIPPDRIGTPITIYYGYNLKHILGCCFHRSSLLSATHSLQQEYSQPGVIDFSLALRRPTPSESRPTSTCYPCPTNKPASICSLMHEVLIMFLLCKQSRLHIDAYSKAILLRPHHGARTKTRHSTNQTELELEGAVQ